MYGQGSGAAGEPQIDQSLHQRNEDTRSIIICDNCNLTIRLFSALLIILRSQARTGAVLGQSHEENRSAAAVGSLDGSIRQRFTPGSSGLVAAIASCSNDSGLSSLRLYERSTAAAAAAAAAATTATTAAATASGEHAVRAISISGKIIDSTTVTDATTGSISGSS